MAKMSKDPKRAVHTPEWARFFTPGEYADFTQLVCSAISKRGLRFHLDDGIAVIRRPGVQEERIGLMNLAQMCRESARPTWPTVIGAFWDTMDRTSKDPGALLKQIESFDVARHKIKVRLHAEDYLQHSHASHLCLRKLTEGICELLVCDLGFANISVPADLPAEWGQPLDELFQLGVKNVRAEKRLHVAKGPPTGGFAVDMLTSGSNYAATHVLFLEDYLKEGSTGYGAIVSVPCREVIFRHVIRDASVLAAMQFMHGVTADAHLKGPGSISREIYWWHAGKLELVPTQAVAGKFVIAPGENFEREVLASMAKGN
jgi:hypothetical protein